MLENKYYENESLRLKTKSQKNRVQRYKQLEFDFGPSFNQKDENEVRAHE